MTGRHERALDALLLIHALEPILGGSPLPLGTWARALSLASPCKPSGASSAFKTLEAMGLITRTTSGAHPLVMPLKEDGSGAAWMRPGSPGDTVEKGYFVIPHDYWTAGVSATLRMPGKAMLLIMLAETSNEPSFTMAVERAQGWYGISERTAERGYRELDKAGLLLTHIQKVPAPRHPLGMSQVYHRADLQRATRSQARRAGRVAKTAVLSPKAPSPAAETAVLAPPDRRCVTVLRSALPTYRRANGDANAPHR